MQRFILFLIALTVNFMLTAQNSSEEKAIKKTIETFFDGLQKGDSTIVSSTLHSTIKLQTTYTGKDGKNVLLTESRQNVLTGIANKKPEHTYFEKLLSWDIKVDGNLASVWTPYEFYLNNTFSHCGANSFQLYNDNGTWKIVYLVDMRRRGNCDALKAKK